MSAPADARRFSPSVERNRAAIAAAIGPLLPAAGVVLEIASGSGEHALHLARAFPQLDWQPSDPDAEARASIAAWRAAEGPPNLRAPLALDAAGPAPFPPAAAVLCINMIHIAPWAAARGLLAKAAGCLAPGAPLILYGPFLRAGVATAPSNLAFDDDLRARNPAWGLRHLDTLAAAADGFGAPAVIAMPANNLLVAFRRIAGR
ncbi:MAG: class I SAM-dependent methyltransferase [Rubritepida sp.]|nr:class I SAM-dependent methyltransferase [Rubritepida sp.]